VLECQGALRCAGGGPTDVGRCAPAAPVGTPCETAVDPLSSYTRQDSEHSHQECAGYCQRHVCHDAPDAGTCEFDLQCGSGKHCAGGSCAAGGAAGLNEPCSSTGCASPLRCVQGTCRAPAPDGAPCTNHRECLGACIPGDGGSHCGTGCAF